MKSGIFNVIICQKKKKTGATGTFGWGQLVQFALGSFWAIGVKKKVTLGATGTCPKIYETKNEGRVLTSTINELISYNLKS